MIDLKIALKNLFRNSRRSLTILLTIACGTGALFLYHGFNTGIMNQYKYNGIRARYGHGQINLAGYRNQVYEKPWEHWIENYSEIEAFLRAQSEIKYLFPRVEFFALVTSGNLTVSGRGQGVDALTESKFFTAMNIVEGQMLSAEEDGVLIGRGLANSLNLKVGGRLTVLSNTVYGSLNGVDLRVVGIFHTGMKEFDDVAFRMQLKQAHLLLDTNKVESVAIGLHGDDDWTSVAARTIQRFPQMEATPFAVLDKIYYQNAIDFLKVQFDAIKSIILFIVVLGIFNSVSTAVFERKQEIGNLRANGESKRDVLRLLTLEGAILGVVGSLIGVAAAILLNNTLLIQGILMPASPGLTRQFYVFVELQPEYSLIVIGLGVFCAASATLLASWKVVGRPIGELLRSV